MPPIDDRDIELLGMMRAEYTRAKRFIYWGYIFEFIAAIAAVLVIPLAPVQYSALTPLFIASIVAIGFLLKHRYDTIKSYAEEARRAIVLMQGIDYHISEKRRAELEKPFSARSKQIAKQKLEDNRSYFATTKPYGPLKLFDMLQESVFWQHSLTEKAAKYAGWIIVGFISMILLALYFMAFVTTGPKQNWVSELLVTAILVFLTSGVWFLRQNYVEIGTKVKHIDDELEAIRQSKRTPTLTDVFPLLNEYDCLLMEAPVLPNFIYKRNKRELNIIWEKRQQEYNNQIWN